MSKIFFFIFCLSLFAGHAQNSEAGNRPSRVAWFQDLGFGMFIHLNVDVTLGAVISHSLAGASKEYRDKYFAELPGLFNPKKFDPDEWAILAKLAGMKYVVFTAKHHSGFCMFDTKTTSFNITNTPFKKDILKEVIGAFREQGIAIGIYFSPEDFYYFHKHDIPVGRLQHRLHYPVNNPGLMRYDQEQLKELLTNYGKIDILFIDGPGDGLRQYAWKIDPDLVITRDAMKTPEQETPDVSLARPWEACYTMGTDWGYKPTNDPHKSGTEIINKLIEIRCKGGNFLLNVGPKPDGEIQQEQQDRLREVALWTFVNGEALYEVKPTTFIREGDVWYIQSNDSKYIYVFVLRKDANDWKWGERKNLLLTYIKGSRHTKVSILGFASELLEYKKDADAGITVESTEKGLLISAVNGQRFYTNYEWPNAVVLKIENASFGK